MCVHTNAHTHSLSTAPFPPSIPLQMLTHPLQSIMGSESERDSDRIAHFCFLHSTQPPNALGTYPFWTDGDLKREDWREVGGNTRSVAWDLRINEK